MSSGPVAGDGGPGGGDAAEVAAARPWAWTLQMNTSMASPLIGLVCAASIGLPLAVGIMAGYPRVGGWGAVGAFFTDMAVFQPGHRFRARIVAGAGLLVAIGAFLGALCGIRSIAIFPVVGLWTIGAGLLVELGPQAALIGVSSATSLVFSASFDVSATQALVVGAVTLASGLVTAAITQLAKPWLARYAAAAPPTAAPGRHRTGLGPAGHGHDRPGDPRPVGGLLALAPARRGRGGRDGAVPRHQPGRRVLDPRGGTVRHATRPPADRGAGRCSASSAVWRARR